MGAPSDPGMTYRESGLMFLLTSPATQDIFVNRPLQSPIPP